MKESKTTITTEKLEATKSLLKLYRTVLHNVNNELYDLDEMTYVTSRKHLSDLVGGLIEYEINTDVKSFNNKVDSCQKSLSLLEIIDETIVLVRDYPITGKKYYEIIFYYYTSFNAYSHEEIMEMLNLSRATYFRNFKKALECFYIHFIAVLSKTKYADSNLFAKEQIQTNENVKLSKGTVRSLNPAKPLSLVRYF